MVVLILIILALSFIGILTLIDRPEYKKYYTNKKNLTLKENRFSLSE